MSDAMVTNSNGLDVCAWPQNSHYNYTFTPVDPVQENDGFFGTAPTSEVYQSRGGPDLFISGAYPVTTSPTTFPAGGNLDQLLKQMSGSVSKEPAHDSESADKENPQHVQEVIDALEVQLDTRLDEAVKGVRVVNGNCFVCLNDEQNVNTLLNNGLNIRGEKINLQGATRDPILVTASGVPHDLSDEALAKAIALYGCVTAVERKIYKGVDTGERILKLKPQDTEIPDSIVVEGSRIALRVERIPGEKETGESCTKQDISSKPMDDSFTADRFRSQISVRLKQPNPKSNRSLDNIFDPISSRNIHNTSLPIINAFDSTQPVDQERKCINDKKLHQLGTAENAFLQPLPSNVHEDCTNIFSRIPDRKQTLKSNKVKNGTDDSTDSVEMFTQKTLPIQNNPFIESLPVSTPVAATLVNPFIPSANYTSLSPSQYSVQQDQQRHLFMPQPRVCSPYPHVNIPYASQAPISTPAISPQNSPQSNKVPTFPSENANYFPNSASLVSISNPGFYVPASFVTGDTAPSANNIPARNQVDHSTQNGGNKSDNTLEVPKHQSTSMPSSPVSTRRQRPSILSHQHSKSSGDEGPRGSPGAARRKISRKPSSTNSINSHQSVETVGGPNATSSPNIKHKTSTTHSRKTSGAVSSGAEASGSSHTNVVDVSRSSSSGQDSPTKPDRRRRVSIYFNNKKGAGKRRDSVFVPNGASAPGAGILTRSLSLEASHRYPDVAGAETTTCSERERTNSASSRTSSATGTSRHRKHSNDVGKVPWCGCWGNGCI